MKKTLLALSLTASAFLTGCGGGGDAGDSGFFWDGFLEGGTQWRCRDASNGQFTNNWMCADQKVNDLKWPTDGVPATTSQWYKGAAIQSVCAESIARYVASESGPYTWKRNDNDIISDTLSKLGITYHVDTSQFWNQSDAAARSYTYKFDDNNWAVFVIQAPTNVDFFPAQCRAFLKDNGSFKGLLPL
jgi:hypothetical protein